MSLKIWLLRWVGVQSVWGHLRDIGFKCWAWSWAQKQFFPMRTVKQWNRLPREVVLPPWNPWISRPDRVKPWGPSPAELSLSQSLSSSCPQAGPCRWPVSGRGGKFLPAAETFITWWIAPLLLVPGLGDFCFLCISESSQVPKEWDWFPAESLVSRWLQSCF